MDNKKKIQRNKKENWSIVRVIKRNFINYIYYIIIQYIYLSKKAKNIL